MQRGQKWLSAFQMIHRDKLTSRGYILLGMIGGDGRREAKGRVQAGGETPDPQSPLRLPWQAAEGYGFKSPESKGAKSMVYKLMPGLRAHPRNCAANCEKHAIVIGDCIR
jgi:hypothetical protein